MAEKLSLNSEEQKLFETLCELVNESQRYYKGERRDHEEQRKRTTKIAQTAHDLHMSLKKRELEPKHHKYMYENRGVPADDMEFYNHLHPAEDLINFVNDPEGNDDPEDSTLGIEFDFRVYTRRWGHNNHNTLIRTENGWTITGASTFDNHDADKSGKPAVFDALQHDIVSYPYNIGEMLEWIWKKASEGADIDVIKKAINDLANWISLCEKATPRGIFEELL